MVSEVYVVGTSACEAEGMGSTPIGYPRIQECASGKQAASKTAQQGSIPCTPAFADVARLSKAPVLTVLIWMGG